MSLEHGDVMKRPVFDRVYSFRVGGALVVFGRMKADEVSAPVIYAAAFTEDGLYKDRCGWGASEAEAAADLMRQRRRLAVS